MCDFESYFGGDFKGYLIYNFEDDFGNDLICNFEV